jgi:hypothetical protein
LDELVAIEDICTLCLTFLTEDDDEDELGELFNDCYAGFVGRDTFMDEMIDYGGEG